MPASVTKNGNKVRIRYVERTITLAELINGYVFITFSDGVRVNAGFVGSGSDYIPSLRFNDARNAYFAGAML